MRGIVTACLVAVLAAPSGCKKDAKKGGAEGESGEPGSAGEPAAQDVSLTPTENHLLGTVPEGKGLDIATPVPQVNVTDSQGKPVDLAAFVGRGPTLVIFYRGGWSPYDNLALSRLAKGYTELEKRHVTPVLISADSPTAAAKTKTQNDISFTVLCDPELAAHEAFHVTHHASAAERAELEKAGVKGRTDFAIPSLFLFGEDGKLIWRHVDPNAAVRPTLDQLLRVLDANGFAPE